MDLGIIGEVAPAGAGSSQLIIFALLFIGMWFLLIAPNRRRQKQHQALLKSLRVGDRVLLSSGIFGRVIRIKGPRLLVEMSRGVRMEVLRGHVQQVVDPQAEGELEEEKDEESAGRK